MVAGCARDSAAVFASLHSLDSWGAVSGSAECCRPGEFKDEGGDTNMEVLGPAMSTTEDDSMEKEWLEIERRVPRQMFP